MLPVSSLAKILAWLAAAALCAAVFSPPAYWLLHGVIDHPFPRFFNRTFQIAAFVLLVPLLLSLKIRHPSEFGIEKNPHPWRDLGTGLMLALLPVLILGAGYLATDIYRVKKDIDPAGILRILGTAGVVAIVEEILFRGVLLGLAVRAMGPTRGALVVSGIFATIHFLRPPRQFDGPVEWWAGFAQIGKIFDGAPPPMLFVLGFVSLLTAGLILSAAALGTRSLWLPIGLHAGWIAGQQGLHWFAKSRIKPPDALIPWIGPNVVSGAVPTGLVPLCALLLTAALLWVILRHVRKGSA